MALLVKISGIQIEFNLEGHPRNRNFRFLWMALFYIKYQCNCLGCIKEGII